MPLIHQWAKLSSLQLGRYAEYYVKMEFTLHGFDVYSAEVDDKGIDFVIRREPDRYYDIQVKSLRTKGYIFFQKTKFILRSNLFAAVALFEEGKLPDLYLIPSTVWFNPNDLFVERKYEGKKSLPEWGINLSLMNIALLEPYRFEETIKSL